MTVNLSYKYSELSETIIGVFYDVYNELGYGFLESVYRNPLQLALLERSLRIQPEVAVPVFFSREECRRFPRRYGGERLCIAGTQDC